MRGSLSMFLMLTILFSGCADESPEKGEQPPGPVSRERASEGMVKANLHQAKMEDDILDAYVRTYRLPFVKTASGIRYYVYQKSAKGDSVRPGMEVTMNFTLSLPDGTPCYSSAETGPRTFKVEHDDVESGIHRGVQHLKEGDKAIILVPSALAHGLLGDLRKVPPQTPVVYQVEIIEAR